MALFCITGASEHFCSISALNTMHAKTIQPFVYLEMVLASTIDTIMFDEQISRALITGSLMIVGSELTP